MGKTYNAPQITLTQKAHYQHKSQFPYCARRVGRSSLPTSRTGKTIGISTTALDHQPTRRPPGNLGSRRHHFRADIVKPRLSPDRKSRLPTFPDINNGDRPPPAILSSNPDLRTPWATVLLAREVPLEPMMEMSGLASQRSSMTGLSSKPRTHRMYNRCRRCENITCL